MLLVSYLNLPGGALQVSPQQTQGTPNTPQKEKHKVKTPIIRRLSTNEGGSNGILLETRINPD